MPSLQCPDCGHIEMLQALNGAPTFRCSGCGRALKVPSQLRAPAPATVASGGHLAVTNGAPAARPSPAPVGRATNGSGVADAHATAVAPAVSVPASGPRPVDPSGAGGSGALGSTGAVGAVPIDGATPPPTGATRRVARAGGRPARVPVPWWQRLAVWIVALPLSLLIIFGGATRLNLLTRDQLLNTFISVGWDRFVPVARLLPLAALLCATLVQVGVTYLERRAAAPPRGTRAPRGSRGESTGS